ncbi:Trem1 [Phodopus roborovskii]|uniref:Trem1 protein n=1 Tax=Phodopus roborovskii TaxID=109678 RepID=A0AAV0A4Z8_PHORO|nr:Trem1 [Phodopus roborovskii]
MASLPGCLCLPFPEFSSSPNSSSLVTPHIIPTKVPDLFTTENMHRDTAMTQPLPKSTDVVSSPDPGVTFTNATNVPRVSTSSIVVPVVCGLFSKTLVFTVLFAVTQKSFG